MLTFDRSARMSEGLLRDWLVGCVAQTLDIPSAEIDTRRNLDEYGLDDGIGTHLSNRLGQLVEHKFSPVPQARARSVEALATYLAAELEMVAA
jgi:hypothetical protein